MIVGVMMAVLFVPTTPVNANTLAQSQVNAIVLLFEVLGFDEQTLSLVKLILTREHSPAIVDNSDKDEQEDSTNFIKNNKVEIVNLVSKNNIWSPGAREAIRWNPDDIDADRIEVLICQDEADGVTACEGYGERSTDGFTAFMLRPETKEGSKYFVKVAEHNKTYNFIRSDYFAVKRASGDIDLEVVNLEDNIWMRGEFQVIRWNPEAIPSNDVELGVCGGSLSNHIVLKQMSNAGGTSLQMPRDLPAGNDYCVFIRPTDNSVSPTYNTTYFTVK